MSVIESQSALIELRLDTLSHWPVFRLTDERARLIPVEIREGGDHYRAVVRGPGDVVIVFPGEALKDGARVRGEAR